MSLEPRGMRRGWRRGGAGALATARGTIEAADAEIRLALRRSRRRSLAQSGRRSLLEAIDECLTRLEELHVHGDLIARRDGCRKVVAGLVEQVGEEPPESVREARTSYDLHSALLNWESTVLDALVPQRRERFPDLNQEADEWPRPRRRHRRRLVPAAQAG